MMEKMKYKTTLRDGNCLFNSVECVLEYEGTGKKLKKKEQEKRSKELRDLTARYLKILVKEDMLIELLIRQELEEEYEEWGTIEDYIDDIGKDGEWGGNIEIIAIAKMLNRSIEVYHQKKREYIVMGGYKIENGKKPIKLFYRGQSHYDFFV